MPASSAGSRIAQRLREPITREPRQLHLVLGGRGLVVVLGLRVDDLGAAGRASADPGLLARGARLVFEIQRPTLVSRGHVVGHASLLSFGRMRAARLSPLSGGNRPADGS
jgi:hypothetical protein